MDYQPQHVKRKCGKNTFTAIERGEKTFELFIGDDVRLEAGDLLTLEEHDGAEYTGRRITRKISYVLNTKDLKIPSDEIERYGITICGSVEPEFRTLRSVIGHSHIVSVIVGIHEEGPPDMLTGPFYVPPLTTPPLVEQGLLDNLDLHRWPPGVFEISLLVFFDEERKQFAILDHVITGVAPVAGEEEGETAPKAVELDFIWLKQGRAKTMEGVDLELSDVSEIVDADAGVSPEDLPPDLARATLKDSLTAEVEEEMDSFLRDEHPEQLVVEDED